MFKSFVSPAFHVNPWEASAPAIPLRNAGVFRFTHGDIASRFSIRSLYTERWKYMYKLFGGGNNKGKQRIEGDCRDGFQLAEAIEEKNPS
ncbi:hypothetical protein [Paenibacillus chitinolyticus]